MDRTPPPRGATDFERQLVLAREGDEVAFAALWRRFNPGLVRFLAALVDRDDVADLASTVWLEVVRGLGRFDGDEVGFRAWLFTMARSRSIDLHRARRRRPRPARRAGDPDHATALAPDPASIVEGDRSTDAAIALIATLPPDQAEVLLLRVVADLDVATVARIVGKRPGTVRVLAHRGLRRLAERLAAEQCSETGVTR